MKVSSTDTYKVDMPIFHPSIVSLGIIDTAFKKNPLYWHEKIIFDGDLSKSDSHQIFTPETYILLKA